MLLQESHRQDVVASVKRSLHFAHYYQKIRPDISPFIAATSELALKNLDDWERTLRWEIATSLHHNARDRDRFEKYPLGALSWLDLCNADGYRRERALRGLSGPAPNRFLLALLIRRLNDWVPEVRNAACEVLPAIAACSDPQIVVDVLFFTLSRWSSWGRIDERGRQVLLQLTAIEQVAERLKNRLIASASGPAAAVFMQAGRGNALDTFLTEFTGLAVQPALRARAYRCQFEGRFVWVAGMAWQWVDKVHGVRRRVPVINERRIDVSRSFPEILRSAMNDGSPMVRRIAAEMLIKALDEMGKDAFNLATILAADTSKSVAERGRFALRALKNEDTRCATANPQSGNHNGT